MWPDYSETCRKEIAVETSFGRTVREARKRRGVSQKQLAGLIGIHFTYLSKIENNRMAL
jgi:HTH-type transcriptional regulator, competence development regulator